MSSGDDTCCVGIILLVVIGVIIYLIATFPIQALVLFLVIVGIIFYYYTSKRGMIPKISSFLSGQGKKTDYLDLDTQNMLNTTSSSLQKQKERKINKGKKRDQDVIFYEFVIWLSMPYVIMYLFANTYASFYIEFTKPSMLIGSIFLFGFLGFVLTAIGIISRLLMMIRRRKGDIKNTRGLLIGEWFIWAIGIPLLILGLFTGYRIASGFSLNEIWNDYFIYRFIIATVFFMGYIVAPIVAYVGVFTRPLLKKKIDEKKMENETKEIINMIKNLTGR